MSQEPEFDTDSPGMTNSSGTGYLDLMDKNEMARRHCTTCNEKDEKKKKAEELAKKLGGHVVTVARADALFVHGQSTQILGGDHFWGGGVNALPSVGASDSVCVVVPNAGSSVADVVGGGSFGGSVSPSALAGGGVSGSFNGSGWMGCLTGSVGVSSPVNVDLDYNWKR